tara:strand:- start:28 stop:327 length:300 start_codon:yes stop_codon:yes gene_type:complete
MSGFGTGPFSKGNKGSLQGAIDAAAKIMAQGQNMHNYMPDEVEASHIDAAAKDVFEKAQTIQQKNQIILEHFNNIGIEGDATTGSVAAFEKAVMRRLGR